MSHSNLSQKLIFLTDFLSSQRRENLHKKNSFNISASGESSSGCISEKFYTEKENLHML